MNNVNCMWYIIDDESVIFFNDVSYEVVEKEYYDNYDFYRNNNCYIDYELVD